MDKCNRKLDLVTIFGITMTTDAFSILVSGLILLLVLISTYGFNPLFLVLILSYGISAYKVNCMIVGSCDIYAKLISIATSIAVVFIIMDKSILDKLKERIVNPGKFKNF